MANAAAFNILVKQATAVLTLCLCCVCPHCVPSWALMAQHCSGLCSKMGASNTAAGQCVRWVAVQPPVCKVGTHLAQGRLPAGEGAERRSPVDGSRSWAGRRAAGHRGPDAAQASVHVLEGQCHRSSHCKCPDVRWELNNRRRAGVRSGGSPAIARAGGVLAVQFLCLNTVACSAGVAVIFKHSNLHFDLLHFWCTHGTSTGLHHRHLER